MEYIVRGRRAGIYAQPSRAALVGTVPHGTVVRGSAPSHAGWIALDDDESFMLDDGSLAAASRRNKPTVVPFAKRIDIPADADLSRASMHRAGASDERRFRVTFSPRVAIRAGTHTAAAILGALSTGDVVDGVLDDIDPNWLRLSGGKGYVMLSHPKLGELLRRIDRPEDCDDDGTFVVRIPRRKATPAAKRPASQPAAAPARAPAPRAEEAARRPRSAETADAAAAGASTRADMAAARRTEKRSKGATTNNAGTSAVEALSGEARSVLYECPASPENVQSPKESVEAWVAVEDGGFAPMAVA